jgi:hypothetical protein
MYVLMTPDCKFVESTVGHSKQECEGYAFNYLAQKFGQEWEMQFWKRWRAAQNDIRKRGYRIVRVRLVKA